LNSKLKTHPPSLRCGAAQAKLAAALLDWFAANARDLPWRRTRDPYAIWVSEIMLQQTQVKTVIPFWERWMRELPTIQAAAKANADKIHKLWEGLGYYTRVRNLQKAAQQIVAGRRDEFHESPSKNKVRDSQRSSLRKKSKCRFPEKFEDVLALPGIGRYTAGAVCSIAFNQPAPILDGNVIRVLTRIFGIAKNPNERRTNARLWKLAEELVAHAKTQRTPNLKTFANFAPLREDNSCSFLNQSLMELGALVCTPRNPQCRICPVKKFCVAFRENRVDELPNLGRRAAANARRFVAFVVEKNGRLLVRRRPAGVVNAHLWEFPNGEIGGETGAKEIFKSEFGVAPLELTPLCTVKHSITRSRITLEAFQVSLGGTSYTSPHSKTDKSGTRITRPSELFSEAGVWMTPARLQRLAFSAAHKKILRACIDQRA
jgi:A/G-specific adenine glycosylase